MMKNTVEPNRPPALGNLHASFPLATSLGRAFQTHAKRMDLLGAFLRRVLVA
jgi:hypothetical protein